MFSATAQGSQGRNDEFWVTVVQQSFKCAGRYLSAYCTHIVTGNENLRYSDWSTPKTQDPLYICSCIKGVSTIVCFDLRTVCIAECLTVYVASSVETNYYDRHRSIG